MGYYKIPESMGSVGEDEVCAYLEKQGCVLCARNWVNTCGRRIGEIDLIMKDGAVTIFVEVKTASVKSARRSMPEERLTAAKLKKMSTVAEIYLQEEGLEGVLWRIDLVVVEIAQNGTVQEIRWHRAVF